MSKHKFYEVIMVAWITTGVSLAGWMDGRTDGRNTRMEYFVPESVIA